MKRSKLLSRLKFSSILLIALFSGFAATRLGLSSWRSHTRASNEFIREHVVMLLNKKGGECTGEQVVTDSGKTYILTAGHCKGLIEDKMIIAKYDDGSLYLLEYIAEDPTSDLLLFSSPRIGGLKVADHVSLHEHIHALSHGGRHATFRTDGEVLEKSHVEAPFALVDEGDPESVKACTDLPKQRIEDSMMGAMCILTVNETMTTVAVIPGSSGGPLVNEAGDLVGVVSASETEIISAMVSLEDIHRFLSDK